MNYYEQFYDDLEFCDPDEDLYHRRGHYYGDDPYRSGGDRYHFGESFIHDDSYTPRASRRYGDYHHRDPYYCDSRYNIDDPYHYRDYRDHENERNYMKREEFCQDRQVRGGRGRGYRIYGLHGRGQGPVRGLDRLRAGHDREQCQDYGISQGANESRGQRIEKKTSDFMRGGSAGNIRQKNAHGAMKGVNFVKAGSNKSTDKLDSSYKQEPNSETSENSQIRFDYRRFQNEPTETEKEVSQAMETYKCQLGFGYGYGPRNDLVEGEQPEWLIGSDPGNQPPSHVTVTGNQPPSQMTVTGIKEEHVQENVEKSRPEVKKAMVSPALNFVKAKSEFHSIDVAFHETEQKPKANSLSVNFGNKRVGLGFGVSASKNISQSTAITGEYRAGVKGGCNQKLDARFQSLQQAIKARTFPNKNAIEIIHMAVDKVKMKIDDCVGVGNRTPHGQAMFLCRLQIEGVYISQGQATTKKGAKHEAYQSGLKVFNHDTLTVKEISENVFELRPKEPEFKVPPVPGQVRNDNMKSNVQQSKSQNDTSQTKEAFVNQYTTSTAQNALSGKIVIQSDKSGILSANQSGQTISTYSKPKMVFHQQTHYMNKKPQDLKKTALSTTGSQIPKTLSSTPEALATKLLNFVKEGADPSTKHQDNTTNSCQFGNCGSVDVNVRNNTPRNSRKRLAVANNNEGKLKVQKKNSGNVHHSIEDLSQFILIDRTPLNHSVNELSMLHNSANFNRVVLKLEYENDVNDVQCSLLLSDIIIAIAHGPTKEEAKQHAVSDSLKKLQECCYTIKIKQAVDSDSSSLTKEQLLSDIEQSADSDSKAIPNSNIGSMLLRKMGWTGGGCGKDGSGIAEPVKAEMIIGREGLGLKAEKGIGKNFHEKVTNMLQDYIRSDEQKDLHFSSELLKEERAIIHKIGQKLGLKTNSKGKNENRYLIVSRKRSAQELLQHVREHGGSTSKYELIPPRDSDYDVVTLEDIVHGHSKQ